MANVVSIATGLSGLLTGLTKFGSMNTFEKMILVTNVLGSAREIISVLQPMKEVERVVTIRQALDDLIGDEENAIIGTHKNALIHINAGILGDGGFEMVTDVLLTTMSNMIAKYDTK